MTDLARRELRRAASGGQTAVTVGVFDGVHLGHRHLFAHLISRAREKGLHAGAVTLHPDPMTVLRPEEPQQHLTSFDERVELLREVGLDFVALLTFSPEVAALEPVEFVSMLKEELELQFLLLGPDNSLGRDRQGSAETMRQLGESLGFEVEVLSEPLVVHEHPVHASSIRSALLKGDLDLANTELGRPYSLSGRVVRGDGRGRELGFPTANIEVESGRALPAFGVYATWARVDGERHASATSVGLRPQFEGKTPTVETFIFDFDGDIYGRTLKIEFIARLSPEMKFESVEQLKTKIAADVEKAREILRE
jgi:riboflavin kinase/FMN adenylyltransferase